MTVADRPRPPDRHRARPPAGSGDATKPAASRPAARARHHHAAPTATTRAPPAVDNADGGTFACQPLITNSAANAASSPTEVATLPSAAAHASLAPSCEQQAHAKARRHCEPETPACARRMIGRGAGERVHRSTTQAQHLMPTCSATTPALRLCTSTWPKPAVFIIALSVCLVGVHADRFGQVAVAVGVARDQLADARQHLERIPVVGLLQRRGDLRELEHQQAAAGLQHAAHLGQRLVLVRHVAQAEGDADEVEAAARRTAATRRRRSTVGSARPSSSRRSRPWRSMASLMSVCTTVPAGADLAWRRRAPGRRCRRRCRARCRPRAGWPRPRCRPSRRGAGPSTSGRSSRRSCDATESNTPRTRAGLLGLVDGLEAEVGVAHGSCVGCVAGQWRGRRPAPAVGEHRRVAARRRPAARRASYLLPQLGSAASPGSTGSPTRRCRCRGRRRSAAARRSCRPAPSVGRARRRACRSAALPGPGRGPAPRPTANTRASARTGCGTARRRRSRPPARATAGAR